MRRIACAAVILLALSAAASAQSDWDTYPARSIADLISAHSGEGLPKADIAVSANPFPSKTVITYTGRHRPLGEYKKSFIRLWVETRDVPAGNADMLAEEYLFKEGGKEYWLPVHRQLVPFFDKELKPGDEITAFFFFLGGYDEKKLIEKDKSKDKKEKEKASAAAVAGMEWVFALEEFRK
ncbi:MAG TPA: hypothetical protein VM936_19925 [Pyrinomonadaceae bacterium]|jgi:hypothetical protein|nr:hypothetical protein [Pyrinomonadaceae bacterium]